MDEVSVEAVPPGDPETPGDPEAPRLQKSSRRRLARPRPHVPLWFYAMRMRAVIIVLAVIAVLLAVSTGWLAWEMHGESVADQQRTAVLTAARQEALGLTTLNKQTGAQDFQNVLAGSAGNLKQQLSQGRSDFLNTIKSASVTSVGTVLDVGVVSVSGETATVLLNVQAVVHNKQTSKPETRLYHWQAALVYSGGRWLVTSMEFV